jgi:DNA helicase-2/ATP-dependent DNA helicase PcrA
MSNSRPNSPAKARHAEPQDAAKRTELKKEQEAESRYRRKVRDSFTRPSQPDGPRNGLWVRPPVRTPQDPPFVQLEGHIALSSPDPGLDGITEFYIGRSYAQVDGVDVFNWRSPLCRLFFDSNPRESQVGNSLLGTGVDDITRNLAAVRTFHHQNRLITDYVDDILREPPPQPLFGRPRVTPTQRPQPPDSARSCPEPLTTETVQNIGQPAATTATTDPSGAPPSVPADSQGFVRAERLLIDHLRAPRAKALAPVLATLQPEQYRLIAADPRRSMIVEGGPGTGKTIIASHRAAYFVSTDVDTDFDGDVLVVGPTDRYTDYIGDVIAELTGNSQRVTVTPLHELTNVPVSARAVAQTSITPEPTNPSKRPRARALPQFESLITAARTQLTNGRNTRLTAAQVYEYLRSNGSVTRPLTRDTAARNLLRNLPPYWSRRSREDRVAADVRSAIETSLGDHAQPTLASPSQGSDGAGEPRDAARTEKHPRPNYRHVIVDEAQDLTLDDWLMLGRLNPSGAWTILGDFHQRRADKTPKNWQVVLRALGLPSDTPCLGLQRGYRSTTPILKFARGLLPASAEPLVALRTDGPGPVIINPIREHVVGVVVQQVDRLLDKYPEGTVAVITTMPGPITNRMKDVAGRANVLVLPPNHSRGLEFDGVIVVEPIDFPRNDHSRHGLLYTALTRPNKELVVVHSKALPLGLQNVTPAAPRPGGLLDTKAKPSQKVNKPQRQRRKPKTRTGRQKPRSS